MTGWESKILETTFEYTTKLMVYTCHLNILLLEKDLIKPNDRETTFL